jgi:hypothetical protein
MYGAKETRRVAALERIPVMLTHSLHAGKN